MRRRMLLYMAIAVGVVLLAVIPGATQDAELRGTIALRNGTAYTGAIQMARLGVTQDATDGIGMQLRDFGALSILVGTQKALYGPEVSSNRGVIARWTATGRTSSTSGTTSRSCATTSTTRAWT